MIFTELELDLLYGLVDFADSRAYEDNCGSIHFDSDRLDISRQVLNNFADLEHFHKACDRLMEKLARG